MSRKVCYLFLPLVVFFASCSVSKNYNPNKKFSPQELQQDYSLLRNILEKKHPAIYWYTPKDSMNFYFDSLYQNIKDSMTELQFGWNVIAPLTQKLRCGHTSFGMSKGWYKYIKDKQIPSFPLHLKVWGDTMALTVNLNKKDSILKRGTLVTSINGVRNHELIQQMFQYFPVDGYANSANYVRLSSNFPYYHRNIFGIFKNYRVGYIDSVGNERSVLLPMYFVVADSSKKIKRNALAKTPRWVVRKERRESDRSMIIDTSINTAIMTLNTFSTGGGRHLRSFMKRSFKKMRKEKIRNFVLDLRNNGGGDIGMYILLTSYLRKTAFKVADTVYMPSKYLSPYTRYIKHGLISNIGMFFLTKKHRDGKYHFGYYERKWFAPKRKNHFNGNAYVLINGPTFSASTLVCSALKGQDNIKLVGEETGGGWYGNSGVMIPDIKLPNTKLRVRLPLFKLVQFNHVSQKGTGIPPDIYIPTSREAIIKGVDKKMEVVKELIRNRQ
ncbi:S41 family peptidase [Ferruginibacter lapsinanis]|uniref:S41 family peptidase n=1 Tax=Ferruginibacter lapsinanis TaxID=563172 RepID=UPI001E4C17D9|nr:S41 family peptidase [Ferruginibacter lapsinanis]UEG50830.1 S41 family peptidase [Ferruginibacter lapsinanis]